MKFNLPKGLQLHGQLERNGVRYGLGAKAKPSTPPDKIARIDCSGYVRYMVLNCSDIKEFPDGSQNQLAWCIQNLRQLGKYSDVSYAAEDETRLFIAFIKPHVNGAGKIGHVWLICEGETYESCGGKGVTNRPWNTGVLRREAYACFEIPVK
ncbi:MAG: hypothetical protein E6Q97_01190 [Desulfurellales bacterium]|nr:MAG: hypothetical protein E6Q97_01190 [Desulfurellales bacterium]